jgi:L-arabinonolactonase
VNVRRRAAALLVDAACTLGEGIVWDARRDALFWTDIQNARLWMRGVGTEETHSWTLPQRVGALAIARSGRLLLGFEKRICLVDVDTATRVPLNITELAAVEAAVAHTRVNDGRTDRDGNFVFGTLNEAADKAPIGSFYQYSMKDGLRRLDLGGVAIPNSICFSPDGRTMYYCDSLERRIMQCDYDASSAHVSNIREFVRLADDEGLPDGSVVDADGAVWNAAWASGQVRRYTPSGATDVVVDVPAQNPTCPAFGGESNGHLYVTSSREEMTTEQLTRTPHAGGVYHCHLDDVVGLPDALFPDA